MGRGLTNPYHTLCACTTVYSCTQYMYFCLQPDDASGFMQQSTYVVICTKLQKNSSPPVQIGTMKALVVLMPWCCGHCATTHIHISKGTFSRTTLTDHSKLTLATCWAATWPAAPLRTARPYAQSSRRGFAYYNYVARIIAS